MLVNFSSHLRLNVFLFLFVLFSLNSFSQDKSYWWVGGNSNTSSPTYNPRLIGTNFNGDFILVTDSTKRLFIKNSGLIGVNTSTPTELFDIAGGNLRLRQGGALNYVLTSDANGVGTWKILNLSLLNDTIKINGFGNISLLDYKQSLSFASNTLSISNGNNVDLSVYAQNLSLASNKLALSNSNDTIDLTPYLPLSEVQVDNYVANNNYLTAEVDSDITNELITAANLNGTNLEITEAGATTTVDLSSLNSLNYWSKTDNKLYYAKGNVGVGIVPEALFHVHKKVELGTGRGGRGDLGGGGISPVSTIETATFLLTNANSGHTINDGLKIQSTNNYAVFHLQESGNMYFRLNNQDKLVLMNNGNVVINSLHGSGNRLVSVNPNGLLQAEGNLSDYENIWTETGNEAYYDGTVKISSLNGNGDKIVIADDNGVLQEGPTLDDLSDNLGNHTATEDLKMSEKSILNTSYISLKRGHGNWARISTSDDKSWYFHNHYNDGKLRFAYDDANDELSTNWNLFVLDGNSGNVGIGTNAPDASLHIQKGSCTLLLGDVTNDKSQLKFWGNHGDYAYIQAGNTANNGKLKICKYQTMTTNIDELQILSNNTFINGNVGIGTDSPQTKLHVKGNAGAIKLEGTNHVYLELYKETYAGGRSGWIGYGSSGSNTLSMHNDLGAVQITATGGNTIYANAHRLTVKQGTKYLSFTSDNSGPEISSSTGHINFWTSGGVWNTIKVGALELGTGKAKIYSDGRIWAQRVKVQLNSPWSDFVFEEDYGLIPLDELDEYVKKEKHLPNIPSADEVEKNGIDLGEMDAKLLEKIEELSLYIIELNNKLNQQEKQINQLIKAQDDEK